MQAGKTKAERKLSAVYRAAVRPSQRGLRRALRALHSIELKTAATLSEDRKRSYLATYTEGVRQARELKRTLRTIQQTMQDATVTNATTPAEAASNETR